MNIHQLLVTIKNRISYGTKGVHGISADLLQKIHTNEYFIKGHRSFLNKQYRIATHYMESCVAEYPMCFYVQFWYAMCLVHTREDFKKAKHEANWVIALNPGWFEGYHVLGRAYLYEGKPYTATKILWQALRLSPEHPTILKTLAFALLDIKKYKEASLYFYKSITIDPTEGAIYGLSSALEKAGDRERFAKVEAVLSVFEPIHLSIRVPENREAIRQELLQLAIEP